MSLVHKILQWAIFAIMVLPLPLCAVAIVIAGAVSLVMDLINYFFR